MIEVLAALLITAPLTGYVTPYAPGVMERVAERRLAWEQVQPWPPGICLAALNDDFVGEWVTVQHPAGVIRCYVVDCAQRVHAVERKLYSLVLEVDSVTYGRIGRGPVTVIVQ